MLDLKNLRRAVEQLAQEKGIETEKIITAIEDSIAAAYKKEYGKKGEIIRSKLDPRTGKLKFWQIKTVVDETSVRIVEEEGLSGELSEEDVRERKSKLGEEELLPRYNPNRHVLMDEAKKIKAEAALGEELEFPLETQEEFGRIAAQTAKQVILQKIREAERESIFGEFKNKEGGIVSGVIQRFEKGSVFVELGRTMGVLFQNEAVAGEHYRPGERMKFLIIGIQDETFRLPGIILSRSHPKFIAKLFELEVPEIADGTVEIKSIAREPGSRTKIALASKLESIDPVGAAVGQRGTRVMSVSNEIGQEKIDIIEWSEDPAKFIANSLSPAKVRQVEISERREARVFIDEAQLSLAIGKGGQNVRLAAKLTGWKIDVRSSQKPEEVQAEGVALAPEEPMPTTEEKTETEK